MVLSEEEVARLLEAARGKAPLGQARSRLTTADDTFASPRHLICCIGFCTLKEEDNCTSRESAHILSSNKFALIWLALLGADTVSNIVSRRVATYSPRLL